MITEIHAGWFCASGRPPRTDHAATATRTAPLPTPECDPLAGLTPSQWAVARLSAEGRSNAEVAAILGIGHGTVRNHLRAAHARLGIDAPQGVRAKRLAFLVGFWLGRQARGDT